MRGEGTKGEKRENVKKRGSGGTRENIVFDRSCFLFFCISWN